MGIKYPDGQKDDESLGELTYSSKMTPKSADLRGQHISDFKEWTFVKSGKPGRALTLKLVQPENSDNWIQEFLLKQSRAMGISIPKHPLCLEEQYLKRCLELIHMKALQGTSREVSLNLSYLDTGYASNYASCGVPMIATDYPMTDGIGELVLRSEDVGIVGSIMGSNSMINILSSPLFRRLGISETEPRHDGTMLFQNKRSVPSNYQGSPSRLMSSPSRKPRKETSAVENRRYIADSIQSNPDSSSALLMDQPSGSSSSQGMLQCMSENGIPTFSFSLDDQKELYVANAAKAGVIHGKSLDYVYSFHFKASGQNFSDLSGIESDLIGKMKVSTSFSLCSSNCKVMESEFVLVSTNDNHSRDIHSLSRNSRRSRKLSKVMDMFKAGSSYKHRNPSIFGGSSAVPEDISIEDDFTPNRELAAIVVKDHLKSEDQQEGGWGLKFLKKSRVKPTVASPNASGTSDYCRDNVGNCLTNMDIIVPAGPHGGPITRTGGPSCLIERWRSGGHCDCGGWDIGCPLKVIKARPRIETDCLSSESQGNCKSFDMFIKGSEQAPPTLKMVNIRDGLYFISFQSSLLSVLQCFAIAVATIHSKTPSLSPKQIPTDVLK